MADDEALAVLRRGREEWAAWKHGRGPGKPDLSGADLRRRDLEGFDFSMVNLSGATLSQAVLHGATLTLCNLAGADLSGARMASVDLDDADCRHADLTDALLKFASLLGTNLAGARLIGADLSYTTLVQCRMDQADVSGALVKGTVWAGIDVRGIYNLAEMNHLGPSTIGIDTVVSSRGQIPEIFLRGCGVPEGLMAYMGSLAQGGQPIQLHSCFISYSAADADFCHRLHNDLQAAGVRCWFAPEDLKIGDRFRDEIESAIRQHDKVLLVLSENSVESGWVRSEVEGAFERETRERKQVLFPVRLDEAVTDTPKAWAADIRRQRHIGDFSRWKDHDSYNKAFERLLRDLRAVP